MIVRVWDSISRRPRNTVKLHIGDATNSKFVIPPGDAWHEVLASRNVKEDTYLLGAMPHMHLLGRDMRLVAMTPEGEAHDLIWIKDWDFNWQDVYHYQEAVVLTGRDAYQPRCAFRQFSGEPCEPARSTCPRRLGRKNDG